MSKNKRLAVSITCLLCLMFVVLIAGAYAGHAAPLQQTAADGEKIFQTKCIGCHTIGGGKLAGPDLKGVTQHRDLNWLTEWLKAPDKLLANGDPIAVEMLKEYNNLPMPNMQLSDADVAALIAYFQQMDSGNAPAPAAPTAPQKLDGDPEYGRKLFTGEAAMRRNGTACIACHSAEGAAALGGGALGPDLTHVYSRFGHNGLSASLATLPFPTMQSIFADRPLTDKEQADLLAFFAQADQSQIESRSTVYLQLTWGIGIGATLLLFAIMLPFWSRQTLGVAQRLRKYGKL